MSTTVLDGWWGERARTVGVSFGVSLGVHALLLALVVASFSRATKEAPLVVSRVKIVWIDPAPAAAPPAGAAEGTAPAAPVVPPRPLTPPPPASNPARVVKKPAMPKPAPAPVPPPVAEPARVVPAAVAPPEPAAGVVDGAPGASGETRGGAVDGGRIGGTGVQRVGDVATAPVLVTRVVPEYPRRARLGGIEGEVVLEVIVDRYGRVGREVKVVRSVRELERAAVAAVQRWRFHPARDRLGTAVAVLMEVPVRFVLREATADASD